MTYEEAKDHLRRNNALSKDGGLFNLSWYIAWKPGAREAALDGDFTLEDLDAIVTYMKGQL